MSSTRNRHLKAESSIQQFHSKTNYTVSAPQVRVRTKSCSLFIVSKKADCSKAAAVWDKLFLSCWSQHSNNELYSRCLQLQLPRMQAGLAAPGCPSASFQQIFALGAVLLAFACLLPSSAEEAADDAVCLGAFALLPAPADEAAGKATKSVALPARCRIASASAAQVPLET